jgi:hypothetical protein
MRGITGNFFKWGKVRIVYFFKSGIGKKLLTVETVKVQKLQVGTNSPILEVIFQPF